MSGLVWLFHWAYRAFEMGGFLSWLVGDASDGPEFGQWRQQLRVVEAVAKLALDVPVSTIAAELGYQSSSAFISMFRKTLGETPQRYLKRREGVMAVGC